MGESRRAYLDEIKNHILYVYENRCNKKWFPTWFDFAQAIYYPLEDIIDACNELVTEEKIVGEIAYIPKITNKKKKKVRRVSASSNKTKRGTHFHLYIPKQLLVDKDIDAIIVRLKAFGLTLTGGKESEVGDGS